MRLHLPSDLLVGAPSRASSADDPCTPKRVTTFGGLRWILIGLAISSLSAGALAAQRRGGAERLASSGTTPPGEIVSASASACQASWLPTFGGNPGIEDDHVKALAVFDDGTGPALYVGGDFPLAGGTMASYVAKWNGTSWSALGSGTNGPVFALYAGGVFSSVDGVAASRIAKWDGSIWSPLGSGVVGFVYALAVFDDGTGKALYAAGSFSSAGGVAASSIAQASYRPSPPSARSTTAAVPRSSSAAGSRAPAGWWNRISPVGTERAGPGSRARSTTPSMPWRCSMTV